MKHLLTLATCLSCYYVFAQTTTNLRDVEKRADSFYNAHNYPLAINDYMVVANGTEFLSRKASTFYNIACCFSLQEKYDSAFYYLNKAAETGYNNKEWMNADQDLVKMHQLPQWNALINHVKGKALNADPQQARFHTEDIDHFWTAYDKALRDTAHFKSIFRQYYFDVASQGLNDYLGSRVVSIDSFLSTIKSMPKYYAAIRKNTFKADSFKSAYYACFQQLKKLYPPAVFPDAYFFMGAFSAGGTASPAGLLINMDQTAKDATIPLDELSSRNKSGLDEVANLPLAIAHELIHYEQDSMNMEDTTVLAFAIREGMADFLAGLTGQKPDSLANYKWAIGKGKFIWRKFKEDMSTGNYRKWIMLSENTSNDNPPMQGYWVGYQICKAYYEKAAGKKKAIYDMLHTKDYKQFLAQSGWEEIVERTQ